MYFNFSSDQQRHFVFFSSLYSMGMEVNISRKNIVTLSLRDKAIRQTLKFFCVLCLTGSYLALPTQIMKANKQRKTPAYFISNCIFFLPGPQGPDLVNSCVPCMPRMCRNLFMDLQSTLFSPPMEWSD